MKIDWNLSKIFISVFLTFLLVFGISPIIGQEDTVDSEAQKSSKKLPFRNTSVTLSNTATAISMDKSAEYDYNPYYAMLLDFNPYWWFTNNFYARVRFILERELTESDLNTYEGEFVSSNTYLYLGFKPLYKVPKLGIKISSNLLFTFPTSKAAEAQTLIMGIGPGVSFSYTIGNILKGLIFQYSVRVTKYTHEYTTSEYESPIIPGCSSTTSGCEAYLNSGYRNYSWRQRHVVSLSLDITDKLNFTVLYDFNVFYLYDSVEVDGVSYEPQKPVDERYLNASDFSFSYQVSKPLSLTLGVGTQFPQLAPDSSRYNPIFNRYTQLYFDITTYIDGFFQQK
jgi:hypothetical protein